MPYVTTQKFSLKNVGGQLWMDVQFWENVKTCKVGNKIHRSFEFQKCYTEILND